MPLIVVVRQRVDAPVDLFDHAHHLPRGELGALLVLREIERGERLPFLADVTVLAAHTQGAGEVAHHPDDLYHRRVFRDDFDVDEGVGWKLAGGLGAKDGRGGKGAKGRNQRA